LLAEAEGGQGRAWLVYLALEVAGPNGLGCVREVSLSRKYKRQREKEEAEGKIAEGCGGKDEE
jgi:hypothetical protein